MVQNEKLIAYVKKELKDGKKKELVVQELKKVRWDDKTIAAIFSEIEKTGLSPEDEREKDKFTMDEFQHMEKKENNKKLSKILEAKETVDNSKSKKYVETELSQNEMSKEILKLKEKMDNILADVEKEEGKIELEQDVEKGINERLSDLSQQIGEIRQTVLSRERYFNKMESEFEKIKEDIQNVNPAFIIKEFEKRDMGLNKIRIQTDKLEEKLSENSETLSRFVTIMSKISSFEAILSTLKDVKAHADKANLERERIEVLVEKFEMLFKEVSQSSNQITEFDMKLNEFKSNLRQFRSEINKVNSTFENYPKQESIKKMEKNINLIIETIFEKDKSKFK